MTTTTPTAPPNEYRSMPIGGRWRAGTSTYTTVDLDPWSGHELTTLSSTSPADVDETYASLVASGAGAHHEPWDAFWGQRYATVVDPDGNHIDLFANL